jgi:hypothetical protein
MASIQEMQADMQTAQAHGDQALAQHIGSLIQQAQGQQSGAIAGEPDLGPVGNSILAGGVHFVHQLPLVGDAAITASRWANDQLNGRQTTWQQANAEAHQTIDSAQQQHPIASTIGGVAGGADTALIGGGALKAATGGRIAAQVLQPATTLAGRAANVGRLALAGGAAGAAQGAAQGAGEQLAAGNVAGTPAAAVHGAVAGGVTGAVAGPVAGVALPAAAKAVAPLATKTAMALSKVFGEDPSDLQAAWTTFSAATGRPPTMAELATLKQRGEIANAAKDSTPIATTLTNAAEDAARARSDSMQTFTQQNTAPPNVQAPPAVQSSGQVANATTAGGDQDYGAARQFGFTIPTEESEALGGVSPSDHLASQVVPLAGLKTADRVRIVNDLQTGKLSGQDAQLLDSKLGAAQGTGANYSPAISSAREDLTDILNSPGNDDANQALALAKANYIAGAQRGEGAQHGESVLGAQTADNFSAEAQSKPNANPNFQGGMASGARSKLGDEAATPAGATSLAARFATDDSLHAKLVTTFGQPAADAFRRLGVAETGAAQNLQPFAKRTPQADDQDGKDLNTGLRALAATASHGVYQFYHGAKVLAGLGMSPAVQEKVAQYLADPKMTQQGINLLRRAGATNEQLRQMALQASQSVGGVVGQSAASATEQ